MIPRIRGRAGQAAEGEHQGKWFYEVSVWDLTGEIQFGDAIQIGPFDSESAAGEAGKKAVRAMSDEATRLKGHEPNGKYLDMKNGGILRPWEEHS